MKKLITAIMAATITAASFGACGEPLEVEETAWVYRWTFTGKTTTGVKAQTVAAVFACGETGDDGAACAVRVPAKLKIKGYTAICSPGCGTETFLNMGADNGIFWQTKPFKAALAGGLATDVANIIGAKKNRVEIAGQANFDKFVDGTVQEGTYNFTYAGFGKYDLKNGRVKRAKGNFAGYLSQPHAVSVDLCTTAGFWDCETLTLTCEGPSIVYGKWSVKYRKGASKRYLNKGKLPKIPAWAVVKE